jgi:hypothetical protein
MKGIVLHAISDMVCKFSTILIFVRVERLVEILFTVSENVGFCQKCLEAGLHAMEIEHKYKYVTRPKEI